MIVIGAGSGVLSAAATLARKGLKVATFEQGSKVGGYMADFERGPYHFEASLVSIPVRDTCWPSAGEIINNTWALPGSGQATSIVSGFRAARLIIKEYYLL